MLTDSDITILLNAKRIYLGYSGGLDSSVLLHILAQNADIAKKLAVIHINHGLSANAENWEQHCKSQCENYDIKFISKKVTLPENTGESLEKLAREARYNVFTEFVQKDDVLLTAHHQNDQAETLLLQLFRGAGIKGMAAMPRLKTFSKGKLFRPLLNYSRMELEAYAEKNAIQYITDESNFDTDFDRNYIRHDILPLIEKSWPNAVGNIARSAEHHADAQKVLDLQASRDLTNVKMPNNTLQISRLAKLSEARQKNVLRYWIAAQGFQLPSEAVLQEIIDQALAKKDSEPVIAWDNIEVRRFNDEIYIMAALASFDNAQIIPWDNQYVIEGFDVDKTSGKLSVRFRQGGERFHPKGRDKSQTLKKLMQEWKIPTWQRDRVQLLYSDDELVAVIGYGVKHD